MNRAVFFAAAALILAGFSDAPGTQAVLDASTPADWRPLDPANTLYMELPSGRVVIELAPDFAPKSVENIKTLVSAHYFDGLAITRSQENYVVQWGDPHAEDEAQRRSLGDAATTIPAEFERQAAGLAFTPIPGPDGYADEVGYSKGFAAARENGKAWLTHCYASLGVGRGDTADSGNGAELYVVIGHAPRNLDRNITLAGRVIEGMEHLSTLARGTGPLGFYEKPEQMTPITSIRLGSELPEAERAHVEVLRTDTETFRKYVDARAHRSRDGWYLVDQNFVDLCNVRVPTRETSRP